MRILNRSIFYIAIVIVLNTFLSTPYAEDWPRWRGAAFDGTASPSSHPFSGQFELRVRWKRSLGAGYSGVVVTDGKAVTMYSDGKNDYVVALSSDTGEEQWKFLLGEAFPPRDGSSGGPVSTPAIDRGVVYALGPRGNFVALNLATGKKLWHHDLVAELNALTPHWGFTTSPLVVANRVVVLTGGTPEHLVTAFDCETGAIAWRTGSDEVSYQSPMITKLGNRDVILAAGDKTLFALDPKSGSKLWSYEHKGEGFYGQIINPVRIGENGLFITNKLEESTLLRAGPKVEPAWLTKEIKGSYATPVVHGDLVLGYSGRFLTAIDAKTGERRWRSRPPGEGFPIIVDGHLVVITRRGAVTVSTIAADDYHEKASLQVFNKLVWTPPSFAEGCIFARDSYAEIAAIDIIPTVTPSAIKTDVNRGIIPGSSFAHWVNEIEKAPNVTERVKQYLSEHPTSPVFEGKNVAHILYNGPEKEVVLRGDFSEIGDEIVMHRVSGTDLHYASLDLEPDARIIYQLLRNTEDAIADPRNSMKGESLNYPGAVSVLTMPEAKPLTVQPATATLRGRIVELELESPVTSAEHLKWGGKRAIKVYLPPNYDSSPKEHYPTAYILLGEEMIKGANLAALLDREIGSSMKPVIAVFVASTNAYELARTFREPHIKMIATQLVPWIDGQFRTINEPAQRMILGADEAGFAAVEIGLRNPQIFGGIVAHSIFPLTGGDQELLALIDRTVKTDQRFYIDWGRYDPRRKVDGLDVPGFSRTTSERLKTRGQTVSSKEWNDGSLISLLGPRTVLAIQTLMKGSSL